MSIDSFLFHEHLFGAALLAGSFFPSRLQLFYSFFKTLVGKEIAVELKNDVALTGTLHSVDQYLNVKLTDVHVVDADRYPQLVRMRESNDERGFEWTVVPGWLNSAGPSEILDRPNCGLKKRGSPA